MENIVFTKVLTQDQKPLRIYAIFGDNFLELSVLQGANVWNRNVPVQELSKIAAQHHLSLGDYRQKLEECVRSPGPDVLFNWSRSEFLVTRVLDSGLKVKYFACKLDKANYAEHVEKIMDKFYAESTDNLQKFQATAKERDEMEQYKISSELKLKEIVERKKSDEEEQYGRFVLLLNEKKHKIQHLTELLEAFKAGRPSSNPTVARKSRKRKLKEDRPVVAKKETVSESEPEEEVNTDEEGGPSEIKNEPSTSSAQTLDFLLDDAPSSHLLPKREPREKGDEKVVVVAPKTEVRAESDKPVDQERSKSPVVDLSTQQLLDML